MIPAIHAVTNDEIVRRSGFLDSAAAVMRVLGPRGAVQLRAPRVPGGQLYDLAMALAAMQERTGAWLIVTDRVDIAAAAGARAVQLTSRSIDVDDALAVAPTLAVGASAHSLAQARAACDARASWIVAGELRDEPRGVAGLDALRDLAAKCPAPVIVIGGVTPGDIVPFLRIGLHGVAAIRGIWDGGQAEAAASAYLAAYTAAVGPPVPERR